MLRLVCISDTHLAEPDLPDGDVLIHAGDLTFRGRLHEVTQQLYWLKKQVKRYKKIIVVPGNHDFNFENEAHRWREEFKQAGIVLLNDQEYVVDGVNFYGSPITPFFHNWAFNRHRGEDIQPYWDMIPEDTHVLITHGPPKGILDGVPSKDRVQIGYDQHYRPIYKKSEYVEHVGCEDLLERIKQLKSLRLHVFGHIHEGYGQEEHFGIKFVNPSIMDGDYRPVNKPIIVDFSI